MTRRLAGVGFVIASAAGILCSVAVARSEPILGSRWGLLVKLAAWSVAWVVAVVCVFRLPVQATLMAVAAVAVALRVAALSGPPTLSDDLYRYSWDGRVRAAGIDPYRYAPDSPALANLREPWLWPDAAGCVELEREPGCTRINRPAARTIYPPAAQAWFAGIYRIAGIEARHKAWQVAGLVVDLALVGLLPFVLRAWNRDPRWSALYALSPFPVVEVVNNGHVDGLAALLVVAALLLAARRRPGWAGALIGGAALVKLYPAALVLALAGVSLWRGVGGAAAVIVAGYLPHVIAVGTRVLGYLPGYLREEDYGGDRFLLAVSPVVGVAALALVVAWVWWRRPEAPLAATVVLGAGLLVATPVQPWYAVTLLAVATVAVRPEWATVVAAGYPYFFAVIVGTAHATAIGRLAYGAALVGLLSRWK